MISHPTQGNMATSGAVGSTSLHYSHFLKMSRAAPKGENMKTQNSLKEEAKNRIDTLETDECDFAPTETESTGVFTEAKKRLASSPETSCETLHKLSTKDSSEILERVAENCQTAPHTLSKLADSEQPEVRAAVAENENAALTTIEILSKDANPDVRFRLAENANTPIIILHELAHDDNPFVCARAQQTVANLAK